MTCVWKPEEGLLDSNWTSLDPDVQERCLLLATSALIMLTYNRVGTCPITVRPCPQQPRELCGCWHRNDAAAYGPHDYVGFLWEPVLLDGWWYNTCGCRAKCAPLSEIDLPGPVGYIESFKIDGVEQDLDSGDWRLDNGHLLVWQGSGPSPVPEAQDLNKPDTEPGTWSITYSQSYPVSREGRIAVTYLAMEFAKAFIPKAKCSLPRGVTNVTRNGVSFTIEAGLFPGGLTEIDQVDNFILKWVPPGSPNRSAQVFDPRTTKPRRTNSVPTSASWRG